MDWFWQKHRADAKRRRAIEQEQREWDEQGTTIDNYAQLKVLKEQAGEKAHGQ